MGEVLAGWLMETFALTAAEAAVASFAIQMVASSIVSKMLASDPPNSGLNNQTSLNTGVNLQVAPATNNKLPVVYGNSFIGGTITDLSITTDNQDLYYVMSLCEVTGGATPDTITFGDVFFGGKLCVFDGVDQTKVVGLTDQSTGTTDNTVDGHLYIYLYSNGSNMPYNSATSAITVMQSSGLTYTWDSNKEMSDCAFAIVHLNYNQDANITNIQQTQFEIINSRNSAGDVLYDYLNNERYGAAIPASQIDTDSLDALNTYCNEVITFTPYTGGSATQARFQMNGFLDTTKPVMQNLQVITDSCDCLLKYNEILGVWSAVVQEPTYTVAMNINDSNMISTIGISSLDISNTFNIAQCQFPDITINSAFNTTQIDLADVAPELLYPNEPVNLQTIQLNLCNNNVQAQLLGTRFLKSARMDLQVTCSINFVGLQLEAGDIVTVTNDNYGWDEKLFRISKVTQRIADDGAITADLTLLNFDPTVYDDEPITQFTPSENTGLPNPAIFGTVPTPTISNPLVSAPVPSFQVNVTTSSAGITQYAEVWYAAFNNASIGQMIFAGTTEVQSNGTPYGNNVVTPPVVLTSIPAGNWYFYTRMVNSIAKSAFSSASTIFNWRPLTFQFAERYLSIAYATSATGTGFSTSPRSGMTYFGLYSTNIAEFSPTPSDYNWYLADPAFSTDNYLLWSNRTNSLMSFAVGSAQLSAGTAQFVPSDTTLYDQTIWNALEDGFNIIDMKHRSGQLIQTGTTTVGTGEIAITNNPQGQVIASLAQLLTFAGGAYTKTSAVANLTIDIYGRVVGFEAPDNFYYTMIAFSASSNQTIFSVTRGVQYVVGNCWVLQNGLLLDASEYTDGSSSVTLTTGANSGDIVTIISFASVDSVSATYNSFDRYTDTLTNQATYTASGWLVSGSELIFLNGTVVNAQDYNIFGQDISFINAVSGDLQVFIWAQNNLSVPNGTPVNVDAFTVVGQTIYPFTFDPLAFNLWNNGALLLETVDYSVASGTYTLASTPTTNLNILVQQTFSRTGAV
jgi:hypothetical protein